MNMYTIQENDYAQTMFPRWDSDGAVELYWDHPDFPNQWSGRCCHEYPYENWGTITLLLNSEHSFGAWSTYRILLGHFGLADLEGKILENALYLLSPETLRTLRNDEK